MRRSRAAQGWEPIEHVALDGLVDDDAQVSRLVSLLERASLGQQRRWLVDLRRADPLGDVELLRLVGIVNRYGAALRKARVALLVAGDPPSPNRSEPLTPFLPFSWRRFERAEEAVRWLSGRPAGRPSLGLR